MPPLSARLQRNKHDASNQSPSARLLHPTADEIHELARHRARVRHVSLHGHTGAFDPEHVERPGTVPGDLLVSLVIPALNEAANLPHVFHRLPEGLHEVVLVDGGSTDGTVALARRLRPDIRIVMQERSGKGDALAQGFAACTGDIIVMADADGSTDPAEIPQYVQTILDGAEFAKGSRFLPGGGSSDITRLRRTGNTFLCAVVNVLFRTHYTDLCYGYNAFLATCLEVIAVDCPGFEVETLINVRAAKRGVKVVEVPSFESDRIHGHSKLHPIRDGLHILHIVVRERLTRSRSATWRPADRSEQDELTEAS